MSHVAGKAPSGPCDLRPASLDIKAAVNRTSTLFQYTYDLAGNRTSVQLNGGTPTVTTYNAPNQISNAGFSYDLAGNLTNDGTAAYTYDVLSRTTVRGSTTYTYNGDGTLISQATDGATTRYTQDLAAPLTQVLQTKVGSAAIYPLRSASPRTPDQGNPRRFP